MTTIPSPPPSPSAPASYKALSGSTSYFRNSSDGATIGTVSSTRKMFSGGNCDSSVVRPKTIRKRRKKKLHSQQKSVDVSSSPSSNDHSIDLLDPINMWNVNTTAINRNYVDDRFSEGVGEKLIQKHSSPLPSLSSSPLENDMPRKCNRDGHDSVIGVKRRRRMVYGNRRRNEVGSTSMGIPLFADDSFCAGDNLRRNLRHNNEGISNDHSSVVGKGTDLKISTEKANTAGKGVLKCSIQHRTDPVENIAEHSEEEKESSVLKSIQQQNREYQYKNNNQVKQQCYKPMLGIGTALRHMTAMRSSNNTSIEKDNDETNIVSYISDGDALVPNMIPHLLYFRETGLPLLSNKAALASVSTAISACGGRSGARTKRRRSYNELWTYSMLLQSKHNKVTDDPGTNLNTKKKQKYSFLHLHSKKQHKQLHSDTISSSISRTNYEWRRYAKRSIPFSALQTPVTDAVLALDRNGSFMISLGRPTNGRYLSIQSRFCHIRGTSGSRGIHNMSGNGNEWDNTATNTEVNVRLDEGNEIEEDTKALRYSCRYPSLALMFYAVPSPAALKQNVSLFKSHLSSLRCNQDGRCTANSISPLLCTIPLLFDNLTMDGRNFSTGTSDDYRNYLEGSSSSSAAAVTTPVKILISSDGAVGVAFLLHSTFSAFGSSFQKGDEEPIGTFVIFSPPLNTAPHSFSSLFSTTNKMSRENNYRAAHSPKRPSIEHMVKSFKCSNVRIGGWNAHTMRNLLWPARKIPCHRRSSLKAEKNLDSRSLMAKMMGESKNCEDISRCSIRKNIDNNNSNLSLCESYRVSDYGYLLFNDEEDGYRLLWIDSLSGYTAEKSTISMSSSDLQQKIRPRRLDLVDIPCEDVVDQIWSDELTGCAYAQLQEEMNADFKDGVGLNIAFEAYLHVDALLSDVLDRRKNTLSFGQSYNDNDDSINEDVSNSSHDAVTGGERLPEFFYNLVSVSDDGRSVSLVIAFKNPRYAKGGSRCSSIVRGMSKKTRSIDRSCEIKIPAALAFFVSLDLFDQSYTESEWVQHASRNDPTFLRQWSDKLATIQRVDEMRMSSSFAGNKLLPSHYSFAGNKSEQKNVYGMSKKTSVEREAEEKVKYSWEPFVDSKSEKEETKKMVESMSLLYPFCDVVNNQAVLACKPVSSINSRNAPVQLCYG